LITDLPSRKRGATRQTPPTLPRPTNSSSKARSDTGFTRLVAAAIYGVAGIALGRDLVNGQVDVLGTQLEEVVE
jgi:hypothetical protein